VGDGKPMSFLFSPFDRNRNGLCPAAEEIRKLSFGEFLWPMSGNESTAAVIG
jgi:hypothetical protein